MLIGTRWNRILRAPENEGGSGGGEGDNKPVSASVLAAFEEHDKKSDAGAGAEPGTAGATKTTPVAASSPAASDKKDDAGTSSAKDDKNSTTSQTGGKESQPGATGETIEAPASWDAESKAEFAKLPPATQKYIAKREKERDDFLTKNSGEFANYRKRFDIIDEAIKPYRDGIVRAGMSDAQYVAQLLALAQFAATDFPGFIREQAKIRNFDLNSLVSKDDATKQFVDPTIKALQDEIATLRNERNAERNNQVQATTNTLMQTIVNFRDAKDEKGNLINPHYEKLEADMEPFIHAIKRGNPNLPPADVLRQAYDRALWANPELRASLIEQERKANEEKRAREEQERAQKAQQAATHKGSPSGVSTSGKNETVEDTVRATVNAAWN